MNDLRNPDTRRRLKWRAWIVLEDGTKLYRYSFESDLSKPDQGLGRLLRMLSRTEWRWTRAQVYDNQSNTLYAQYLPQDLGRQPATT